MAATKLSLPEQLQPDSRTAPEKGLFLYPAVPGKAFAGSGKTMAKDLSVGHTGFRRCRADVGKVSLPRQEGEEERGGQRTCPELFMKNG